MTLRPSRGSHLVLRPGSLPGLRAIVTVPVPGSVNRFVMVLPQPDGTHYVGLTDEPVDGPVPDVPVPTDAEVDFLLGSVADAFERPLERADVAGCTPACGPLLDTGGGATADLSRSHTVLASSTGVVTVVGGKLTTYRRMAEDAVDAVLARTTLAADPCRTRTVPLDGAARRPVLAALAGPRAPGPPLRHGRRPGAGDRPGGHRARATRSCSRPSPTACPPTSPSWSSG